MARSSTRRLVILATEFPPGPGGIGNHAWHLATGLADQGWDVLVVAPQPYARREDCERFNARQNFRITPLEAAPSSMLGKLARIQATWRTVQEWDPHVIIASGRRALWAGAVIAPFYGRPIVAVGHGSEFLVPSMWKQFITKWALGRATCVVAVSRYTADVIRRECSVHSQVIPNGADTLRFQPKLDVSSLRDRLSVNGEKIFLTVGTVKQRKAQDVVIRAIPVVKQHVPDVLYLVAGLPAEQQALERLAEELDVSQSVRFLGVVPDEDLPLYYNLADLFVLVSRGTEEGDVEGYGIVVMEAASCGCPAVVSDSGGLPETVKEAETGMVVPTDDVEATAAAIAQILGDDDRRKRMSTAALGNARRSSWKERIVEYHDLLLKLTGP